nr:DUF262 domain-containing protein [Helicobacter salomonis]
MEGRVFKIPAYQRGYRWTKKEVRALLEDVVDFIQESKQEKDFYSLQPIVVKKIEEGGIYHVIDGQQRLTTIFLIIKYFEGRDLFTLHYETRGGSFQFLQNIQEQSAQNKSLNIDFYHFSEAYRAIKKCVEEEKKEFFDTKKQEFLDTLYDRCKVLWHESQDKEKEVFVRLNSGKIPPMEAEKIKALFLIKRDEDCEEEVKRRAEKWYMAEKGARENRDFVFCVLERVESKDIMRTTESVGDKKPVLSDDIQRITAYLKAVVPYRDEADYLFDYFYKQYKDRSMSGEWGKLEEAMDTLSGFASNKGSELVERQIFHYLGFLIYAGGRVYDLYKRWLTHPDEQEFANYLFEQVQKKVQSSLYKKKIEELTYHEDKDKQTLQTLLLLFNLAYLIADQSSNVYFQFNRFVLEQWSLEHIYAQNSKSVCSTEDQRQAKEKEEEIKEWLKEVQKYLENDLLYRKISTSLKKTGEKFFQYLGSQNLLGMIDKDFSDHRSLHRLQNLTLLDVESNSAIGNLIFSHKRKEIEKRKHQDKLIPICTQKVFEKAFSQNIGNPDVFTTKDQEDYLDKIIEYLEKYGINKDNG